jgi:DNA-binding NtrC family response regulator
VEDDQRLRDLAHEVLAMQGYDVLVAPDPEEALRTCAAHAGPIHLLLTDVVMPHMSGRVLADRLMPLRPETRVLYMSGYTDDAILHHGVHQAEVDLLQKPFTPVGLAQRVREALDAAEASSTHRRQAHGTDRGTRPPTTP